MQFFLVFFFFLPVVLLHSNRYSMIFSNVKSSFFVKNMGRKLQNWNLANTSYWERGKRKTSSNTMLKISQKWNNQIINIPLMKYSAREGNTIYLLFHFPFSIFKNVYDWHHGLAIDQSGKKKKESDLTQS